MQQRITPQLAWTLLVLYLSTLQFGFHLAELNAPMAIMACQVRAPGPSYESLYWGRHGLPQCIPMDNQQTALVTTMFTVGGLLGLVFAGRVADMFGRRHTATLNTVLFIAGCGIMTWLRQVWMLYLARFVNGVGAGALIVVTPLLISEVLPINHRGFLGALAQLAVAVGILVAQVVSIAWLNGLQWRNIFALALCLSVCNFVCLFSTVESPKWLVTARGEVGEATDILHRLRLHRGSVHGEIHHWRRLLLTGRNSVGSRESGGSGSAIIASTLADVLETTPLKPQEGTYGLGQLTPDLERQISAVDSDSETSLVDGVVLLFLFMFNPEFRRQFLAVAVVMVGQQATGINAVTMYGVLVLQGIFPESVLLVTMLLLLANVVCIALVLPLIDRLGRRPLLVALTLIMGVSLLLLAVGLVYDIPALCVTSIFFFVCGFLSGLGPVPFLMIPELVEHQCIGSALLVGLVLNWCATILVAYFFPLLKAQVGGSVFLVFTAVCLVTGLLIVAKVPETKDKGSYEKVWEDW